MSMSADDFFAGGTPSARFDTVGVTVAGPITRVGEPMQQRDFTTGAPKVWDDGRPMMQLPVDVKTDMRDPEISNDDGTRALYVRGEMQKAIRTAVRQAGAPGLRVGGHLSVTYSGDGQVKQRGMNPPKLYTAVYTPPATGADAFLGDNGNGHQAAAQPAVPQVPAQQTAPAAAQPAVDPALQAAIAHLTPQQQAAVLQLPDITAQQVHAMFPAPAAP